MKLVKTISLILLDLILAVLIALSCCYGFQNQEMKRFLTSANVGADPSVQVDDASEQSYLQQLTNQKGSLAGLFTYQLGGYSDTASPVVNRMTTPIDIAYYSAPGDKAPAYVIPKGTEIILSDMGRFIEEDVAEGSFGAYRGYGFITYPTAEKGWRLANPFWTGEDQTYQGPYYVKLKDLQTLLSYRAKTDSKSVALNSGGWTQTIPFTEYINILSDQMHVDISDASWMRAFLLQIDSGLLRQKMFYSKDFFNTAPSMWISIAAAAVWIAVNICLLIRLRKCKAS